MEDIEVVNQQEHQESLIGKRIMPMLKQTRQQKFTWTEEADRYVRRMMVLSYNFKIVSNLSIKAGIKLVVLGR